MLAFIFGIYLLLGCIAFYMCINGAGIVSFTIFIYPTVLFAIYFILKAKLLEEKKSSQASQNIVKMIVSNNDGPAFTAETLDELEENMKKLGIELHCDLSGYMK